MLKKENKLHVSMRMLTSCAMMTAMSVILARFLSFAPNTYFRLSFESVPIVISGILFGPLPGACVGFASDILGCLFSPYGYNPVFSAPPVLYGLVAGLFSKAMKKGMTYSKLFLAIGIPALFGSVLIQSYVFNIFYTKSLAYFLATRALQYTVITVVDVFVIKGLFNSNLFYALGLWREKHEHKRGS